MLQQKFIDRIEELRNYTHTRLVDLQTNLCPMVKNINLEHQYEYWYDGYRYNVWEDNVNVYSVHEIPYCYTTDVKEFVFMEKLDVLVEKGKVWPFLLFINGTAIQWSKITVIHDYEHSYLRIDDYVPDESLNTTIVSFPINGKHIRYGEDNDVLTGEDIKGLYFDENGLRVRNTTLNPLSIRLEILLEDIYFKEVDIDEVKGGVMDFPELPRGFVPTFNNILIFNENGYFNYDGPDSVLDDCYNGAYSMFQVDEAPKNAKWAILMYNTNSNKSKSHVYDRGEDLDEESIKELITTERDPESEKYKDVVSTLLSRFDFEHDRNVDYEENVDNAARYITRYDYRLWKDSFTDDYPLRFFAYTGAEFLALADETGYAHFSRREDNLVENVLLVFVNGELYRYNNDIMYNKNSIDIPVMNISADDQIELVMFTECQNYVYDIVVPDNLTPVFISKDLNITDYVFFSSENQADTDDSYDLGDTRRYVVDVLDYTECGDGKYAITFANPYYYGKDLKYACTKQFRQQNTPIHETVNDVVLSYEFAYCHYIEHYIVFKNGRKVDNNEYEIIFADELHETDNVIHFNNHLEPGDYVDVFYIPEIITESFKEDAVTKNGLLYLHELNNYPKEYPLTKDTVLVFVNGLKIHPYSMRDLDMNGVLIDVRKFGELNHVVIMEFLNKHKVVGSTVDLNDTGGHVEESNLVFDPKESKVYIKQDEEKQDSYILYVPTVSSGLSKYLIGEIVRVEEDQLYLDPSTSTIDGTTVTIPSAICYVETPDVYITVEGDIDDTKMSDTWKIMINNELEKYGGESGVEGIEELYGKLPSVDDD